MRIISHLGLGALFALAIFINACKEQVQNDEIEGSDEFINEGNKRGDGPKETEIAPSLPAPATEIHLPPLVPETVPIAPGQGFVSGVGGPNTGGVHYKGGSQGHERPKDTGNVDAEGPRGPNSICG